MPLNVLIVEAHALMRQGLCDICADLGHEVDSVSSGEEGIERVREKDYGLVFMAAMEGVGIEAAKKIKKLKPNIPIYIASTHDFTQEPYKIQLEESGANGYIDKLGGNIAERIAAVLKKHDK